MIFDNNNANGWPPTTTTMTALAPILDDDGQDNPETLSPRLTQGLRLYMKSSNYSLRDRCRKLCSNGPLLSSNNNCSKINAPGPANNRNRANLFENKYSSVKKAMLEAVDDKERGILEDYLKNLEQVATDLLHQNDSIVDRKTIESGAFNLLKIFTTYTDCITDKNANRLLIAFGPFSNITAKRAHDVVDRIRNTLPQYDRANKKKGIARQDLRGLMKYHAGGELDEDVVNGADENDDQFDDNVYFGNSIKFGTRRFENAVDYSIYTIYETNDLLENFTNHENGCAEGGGDDSSSSKSICSLKYAPSNNCNSKSSVSYNNHLNTLSSNLNKVIVAPDISSYFIAPPLGESRDSSRRMSTANGLNDSLSINGSSLLFDITTLIERLTSFSNGAAPDDICRSVIALLESNKRDDALQNDLFDLLGFENFNLIKDILHNRAKLVYDYYALTASSSNKIINESGLKPLIRRPATSTGPVAVGQIISVESDREFKLAKDLRKEDKRLKRIYDKDKRNQMDEFTDIDDIRKQELMRDYQLSQKVPLFSRERVAIEYQHFPFVFDSSLAARNTASYISGNKLILPENVQRNDNSVYEEISLEPSPPPPTDIGANRIRISELDELAKSAFSNTKQLNQIQTVVFDKAYRTNENLLICAPTGAGKTNIAMLCVLNVLRQYIKNGQIQKNEFKIVYVAPMKALAAEMVRNFGSRLENLKITVKELTGDMQLTRNEIMQTQMLVTTPEKWDVVTRKSTGDVALSQLVRLVIIDEIHLLHDDRGPVIETLVARTLRQVEVSQTVIRIVGLSATLPNYVDVANFLRVNPMEGLFFFDGRFRPVPLGQSFIGVKAPDYMTQMKHMDQICYDKTFKFVKDGHQVMIFVHARNATGRIAAILKEMANNKGHARYFIPESTPAYGLAQKMISKTKNRQLCDLFNSGFLIHHAGLLRHDRNIVEKLFAEGHIRVLCCTATLAWGVNLPAHAVIIRGTNIYDAKRSSFVDLGILDVQQIFGRAGRPQFDKSGHGTIITTHNKLSHYLSLLTRQIPIESQFINSLLDNLNAEIVLGTVANVEEAVEWLSYTYLYVRMRKNPMVYGITYKEVQDDPTLYEYRKKLIKAAGCKLDNFKMIRYDESNDYFHPTDIGRMASYFYIKSETVEVINDEMKDIMTDDLILGLISKANEFNELKVREDEISELEDLYRNCRLPVPGGPENTYGKVNILIQAHISRLHIEGFSLISDMSYVIQNTGRVLRALFEMALRKNNSFLASAVLNLCKNVEQRMWRGLQHPLMQMLPALLRIDVVEKLRNHGLTVDRIREMDPAELKNIIRYNGAEIKAAALRLPNLELVSIVRPITRSVLRVHLEIRPNFIWDDRVHGRGLELFHIWIEDPDTNQMYHREEFILTRKQVTRKEPQLLIFTVPINEPMPSQYLVRWMSDRWIDSSDTHVLMLTNLILPERHPPHTALLNLQPLPITALGNEKWQSIYNFKHFNAVQTQIFFCLFHTDENVLVGAPTGSGKTVAAELAMLRMFKETPNAKAVYIAPLKALVRERMKDWKVRFEQRLLKTVVELTGDITPDIQALSKANIIVTTPEKWDGISRSWQNRSYVRDVALIVIDEIHLLGEERGPVLEVIVSRTNFISTTTNHKVRIVGLSTALANARDLADWLSIRQLGLYNFQPSVRPVPLEVHVSGFSEKHYCPRMATMNKPAFQAINTHSPKKPVLIFVSSRRQTRLTAFDLIAFLAGRANAKQWMHMPEEDMYRLIQSVRDQSLKLTLSFGIGMHHAGLHDNDRKIVEELFGNQKIQVLIATATLAWGVNFPAHLVIIKGTEYYDGKSRRYVDFPITDVLQMMGRAGRPQFDEHGVAVVLVHDVKKEYYKKFLYEPFPVESSLLNVLPDHLNAEIVAGTLKTKQQAINYLTWTYYYRRVLVNPSYYGLMDADQNRINHFLMEVIDKALLELQMSYCVSILEDNRTLMPLNLGRIASYYYLQHKTVKTFREKLSSQSTGEELLKVLTSVPEYDEIPVRHNEDAVNCDLAKLCPLPVDPLTYDDSHTKANLLYQAHFSRLKLPATDYETDLKSVLDQSIRILQAMLDVAAEQGWLATCIRITQLFQMVIQARWIYDSPLSTLPHIEPYMISSFTFDSIPLLKSACRKNPDVLMEMFRGILDPSEQGDVLKVLFQLPIVNIQLSLQGWWHGETNAKSVPIKLEEANIRDAYYIPVHANQEYTLCIFIERVNKKLDHRAYAPKFPKAKDDGWFLILGDVDNGELLALKRIGNLRNKLSTVLSFTTPSKQSRAIYTIFLLSDCYMGVDMQYDLYLDIIPPSIECQMNAELSSSDDF